MESKRQQKINKLLQKDLGDIFQRESADLFGRAMITVTKVQVTSDLSVAKVYISIFGSDASKTIQQVRVHSSEIRKKLGMKIKNQLRQVPMLQYYIDDSLDYIENIEKLLK